MEPRTLPPTSAAVMYHSLLVYYHVMNWKGKCDSMKPEECGVALCRWNMPTNTD